MVTARCSRGHEWELPLSSDTRLDTAGVVCPICGETTNHTLQKTASPTDADITERVSIPVPADHPRPSAASAGSSAIPLPTIPGYEIQSLCGRGGMGVVYKARQVALDRIVALKMLHSHVAPEPDALLRFRAEAQAVAQLHHPHIVQVYDIGEHEQRPYFTLEYVAGGSLSARLRRTSYAPREAARLIETVARAVHYAHQHGIMHRDLKPGNILLDTDGTPKLTDFGLAKRFEGATGEQPSLTRSGEVMGTPSYMAPEQATGMKRLLGPATDVYALGSILYQMLTGRPPFEGDEPMETLLQVVEQAPVPPQKLQPRVPRDLQTICLKCLEKEPARRYTSAEALADDLRAYLAGDAIRARPVGRWEQFTLWLKRRPLAALIGGLGLVLLVGVLVGAFFFNAVAVGLVAAASVLAAAGWYGTRLRSALRRVDEQNLEMERTVERLHLLLETTHQLMRTDNLDALLRLLSEATTRLVNAERATVYLMDAPKQELWSRVALGQDVGEIRVALGSGIAGTVAQTGEVINLADPYADPRFNPDIDRRTGYRTTSLLTFPMRAERGEILGVFQVLNRRTGSFDGSDVELLQALARCAAAMVEKAQRS